MPNFRKLEPEEIKTIENKGNGLRKQTEELYDAILADYEVGDYGEAVLDAGENRLTVRNRMGSGSSRMILRAHAPYLLSIWTGKLPMLLSS